jgi:hypothetical protein
VILCFGNDFFELWGQGNEKFPGVIVLVDLDTFVRVILGIDFLQ